MNADERDVMKRARAMLASFEWSGWRGWGVAVCPECECFSPAAIKAEKLESRCVKYGDRLSYGGTWVGHDPNCALPEMVVELDICLDGKVDNELERLRAACEAMADVLAAAVNYARRDRGGQQVPFHGDFAAATQLPSFVQQAAWWSRYLRAALSGGKW